MIKMINDTEKALIFAHEFAQDLVFSHPMLSGEAQFYKNLAKAVGQPEKYRVIGIYQEETLTGLFSFLVIPEEKYLEMTAGLSRTKEDYEEVMDYLKKSFPGYKADFVYNPRNLLMDKMVRTNGARMETDMQEKMILSKIVPVTTDLTVIPYSEDYREGYCRIHNDDSGRYWTAEKTIEAKEKFQIFLALEGEKVVGYIDMTIDCEENEPFDLFVCKEFRNRGYGRALLHKAIQENAPQKMMLMVDVDNAPARHLYQSMGFVTDPCGGCAIAYLQL